MKRKQTLRFLVVLAAVLLFSGFLVFSALKVRYAIEGAEKTEFNVIRYSLTDSIKRGQNGGFAFTSVSASDNVTGKGEPAKTQPAPCPT